MSKNIVQYQSNSISPTMNAYWPSSDNWFVSDSLSAIHSLHAGMYQKTYGAFPASPLAIIWVQPKSENFASVQAQSLNEAALHQYQVLGDRLAEIAQMDEPPVEAGAVATADQVLTALAHHRVQPPEITWHGGDAIAMLWRLGSTSYAITVTDGELGFVVRSEKKTLRRQHSIPLDEIRRLVAE